MFAVIFVPAGVGAIASTVLRTKWGMLLNFPVVMSELWQRLVGAPQLFPGRMDLPSPALVAVLIAASLACVAVLNARIRAREVVRG